MNIISEKISNLVNSFLNDKIESNLKFFKQLKNITLSVWGKCEELNRKFENIIEDNTRRLNNQISINKSNNY